jgi:hypothetical protein
VNVVSFKDFAPTPRYDAVPWHHLQIEESATKDGPWTLIDTIVLSPVDADPSHPQARNFTTENAVLSQGWYRVTFFDATGDSQQPTSPIFSGPEEDAAYLPSVAQVGARERARTIDRSGVELGTFTGNTKPTDSEVISLIRQAGRDVSIKLGGDVPEQYINDARELIAIRTAMLIELSYYPEQVAANNSTYDRYKTLYDEGLASMIQAISDVEGDDGDTEGAAGMPHFNFAENKGGLVGYKTVM